VYEREHVLFALFFYALSPLNRSCLAVAFSPAIASCDGGRHSGSDFLQNFIRN